MTNVYPGAPWITTERQGSDPLKDLRRATCLASRLCIVTTLAPAYPACEGKGRAFAKETFPHTSGVLRPFLPPALPTRWAVGASDARATARTLLLISPESLECLCCLCAPAVPCSPSSCLAPAFLPRDLSKSLLPWIEQACSAAPGKRFIRLPFERSCILGIRNARRTPGAGRAACRVSLSTC